MSGAQGRADESPGAGRQRGTVTCPRATNTIDSALVGREAVRRPNPWDIIGLDQRPREGSSVKRIVGVDPSWKFRVRLQADPHLPLPHHGRRRSK